MIVSICLSLMVSVNSVFALQNDNYYCERGQINLNNLEISLKNEELDVQSKSRTTSDDLELFNELCENEEFKEDIIRQYKDNNLPNVIGFANYEMKEVEDKNGNMVVVPKTVSEVQNNRSVPENGKHNLTITLSVNSHDADGVRYIGTCLTVYWKNNSSSSGSMTVEGSSPDYVSISYPSPYRIETNRYGGVSGVSTGACLEDIYNYSYVASFYEKIGTTYVHAYSQIDAPTKKSRRFTAQYVHTFSEYVPSYSYSSDGTVTFNGVSSTKDMWKCAVYVDYTC